MSQFPVTKDFGTNPSDVIGSIKLKGGISELVAEGLCRFEVSVKDGRLHSVSLVTAAASPSVGRRWEKANEGNEKREATFRDFINKAKAICRDELEDDGMNALPLILAKLPLFEIFMREHGDKVGVPRLTVDGFVKTASVTWGLGEGQAGKLRASLLEVVKDKIREDMEGETK